MAHGKTRNRGVAGVLNILERGFVRIHDEAGPDGRAGDIAGV